MLIDKGIVRPLDVIVLVIQRELENIQVLGINDGRRCTIGQGLLEAKSQVPHGEWLIWLEENFELHDRTARRYMQFADETNKKLDECRSAAKTDGPVHFPSYNTVTDKRYRRKGTKTDEAKTIDVDAWNRELQEAQAMAAKAKQQHQRDVEELQSIMAMLIQQGYKQMAKRAHPDKGGSDNEMQLLNRAKEKLFTWIEEWSS